MNLAHSPERDELQRARTGGGPRVMLFGNVCNNFYAIAKALNEYSNVRADLFLDYGETLNPISNPDSLQPGITADPPSWLKIGQYVNLEQTEASPLIAAARDYDLAIVSAHGPKFFRHVEIPWCFWTTGADICVDPFWLDRMRNYEPQRWLRFVLAALAPTLTNAWVKQVPWRVEWQRRQLFARGARRNSRNQRDGLRTARVIMSTDIAPKMEAIRRLRLPASLVHYAYNPLLIESERFAREAARRPDWFSDSDQARLTPAAFKVFMASRLVFQPFGGEEQAGGAKHNDLFLRAYARFCRSVTRPGVLMLLDSVVSRDVEPARALVRELGIEDRIVWIQAPERRPLSQSEMLYFYAQSDLVADDFGAGWFGSCLIESMSAGTPVITFADHTLKYYPWHPVLSTRDEAVIEEHLSKLAQDEPHRAAIAAEGLRWIEEFHSLRAGARHWAGFVRQVLAGEIPTRAPG